MASFRRGMSSIIAKPLRRRSHRTVALERFLLSPVLREPDRGRRAQRYQRSSWGLCHARRGPPLRSEREGPACQATISLARCIRSLANFADGFPSRGGSRVPDPRRKSDVFDGRVLGGLWRRIEHRPCGRVPYQALFPQALTVFIERLLRTLHDRLPPLLLRDL